MTQPPDFNSCSNVACVEPGLGDASTACASSGTMDKTNQFIPISSLFKCTSWRSANSFHCSWRSGVFRLFPFFWYLWLEQCFLKEQYRVRESSAAINWLLQRPTVGYQLELSR